MRRAFVVVLTVFIAEAVALAAWAEQPDPDLFVDGAMIGLAVLYLHFRFWLWLAVRTAPRPPAPRPWETATPLPPLAAPGAVDG